eukprot:scaffold297_cov108-Isochrysis_galbana.AAC.26
MERGGHCNDEGQIGQATVSNVVTPCISHHSKNLVVQARWHCTGLQERGGRGGGVGQAHRHRTHRPYAPR